MKGSNIEETSRLENAAEHYHPLSSLEDAVIKNANKWWIEQYVNGPAILEMGSGEGAATEMLLNRGETLDIVEGSSKHCKLVADRIRDSRLKVINCLYEEFEPLRRYDDIVVAGSLEIVENPVAILARAHNWLSEKGRLHVVVQNAASLHRRIGHALGILPRLDSIGEHNALTGNRRIYTKEMLEEQVRSAGLRIEIFRGFFLKPFDYATMSHASVDLVTKLIPALQEVSKSVPDDLCASFYACCTSARNEPE
jgi:trans-aconitate methyltransferase